MHWKLSFVPSLIASSLTIAAVVFTGISPAEAQTTETGFLDRSLVLDGIEYKYQVYVPRDFQRTKKWPVILSLHGGGDYGSDGLRQTGGGIAIPLRQHPERFPALVVFPQALADKTASFQFGSGRAALAAVDKSIAEFNGDKSRVYLTGYSSGANGAWFLAYHYPERFAALLIATGYVSDLTGKGTGLFYPQIAPASAPDRYADVAKKTAGIPTWIFHGDDDKNVSVEEARQMYAALKALGANVQYTELAGAGHNTWTPAYDRADVVEWMLQQRRAD